MREDLRVSPVSFLNELILSKVRRLVKKYKLLLGYQLVGVSYQSVNTNIYHCCVHKTASQWLKAILSDPQVYAYSGLRSFSYQSMLPGGYDPRIVTDRVFVHPFPQKTVVTPLYIGFEGYLSIPKPQYSKAFFVMRDPRDLVVSWYFSARYSHPLMGELPEIRNTLNNLPMAEGLLYTIDYLNDKGIFAALQSWVDAPQDPNVLLIRFEELTRSSSFAAFQRLLTHCDIRLPDEALFRVLNRYSFKNLKRKRQRSRQGPGHYRKGKSGDWVVYFDEVVLARFKEVTRDLVIHLGYEEKRYS